jgi:hypothetical protein
MEVLSNLELKGIAKYLEMKIIYEKILTKCQEYLTFKMDTKCTISIDQIDKALMD